jgi:hypothetical protein
MGFVAGRLWQKTRKYSNLKLLEQIGEITLDKFIYIAIYSDWIFFCASSSGCPATIFCKVSDFRNQSSHVENRTEPASQIPEEG